jgi:hypothetical protein
MSPADRGRARDRDADIEVTASGHPGDRREQVDADPDHPAGTLRDSFLEGHDVSK